MRILQPDLGVYAGRRRGVSPGAVLAAANVVVRDCERTGHRALKEQRRTPSQVANRSKLRFLQAKEPIGIPKRGHDSWLDIAPFALLGGKGAGEVVEFPMRRHDDAPLARRNLRRLSSHRKKGGGAVIPSMPLKSSRPLTGPARTTNATTARSSCTMSSDDSQPVKRVSSTL